MLRFTEYINESLQRDYQIQEATNNTQIHNVLVATGQVGATTSESEPRVANIKKLSAEEFIELIKSTFPEVDDVRIILPKDAGSKSGSFDTFIFTLDGREISAVLAGEVKGRGSSSTVVQEVSWLLVLSAMYVNSENVNPAKLIDGMKDQKAYQRVYDESGKALTETKVDGLVAWLFNKSQKKWLESHIGQCTKFIKDYPTPALYFRKDKSKLPIVNLAKEIFSTSVPDQKFDKDKWNPADVWLEYQEVPTFNTLSELNNYLEDSISGKISGILGVSLKLGTNSVTRINMKGERPEYEVTDFNLTFGDLFAQSVSSKYSGNELEGYSVTYRVFDASATSLIRGEAQKKKSLAAHGKVFLKYMDFLLGRGRIEKSVEAVKGILVKEEKKWEGSYNARNPVKGRGMYSFTKKGEQAFAKIKRTWPLLQKDSGMMKYGSAKAVGSASTLVDQYKKLVDEKEFLDYVAEYAHKKKLKEVDMQTRVSVRFQTIMLGVLLSAIKTKSKENLYKVVLGMLLYGKSESDWSAPHLKAQ
jgi:hypothetical protein